MEGVCRLRSPSPRPAPSCAGLPPERQGPNRGIKGEKKRRQGGRESGAKCLSMPAAPPGARTRTTAGRGLPHTHPTPQPDPPSPCDEPRPTRAPQARTSRSPYSLYYLGAPGLEESRRRGCWAETADLVGAKPGGVPMCAVSRHASGEGHREGGENFAVFPLISAASRSGREEPPERRPPVLGDAAMDAGHGLAGRWVRPSLPKGIPHRHMLHAHERQSVGAAALAEDGVDRSIRWSRRRRALSTLPLRHRLQRP